MEHIQKDDIIIRKGILHILDSHTGYLGLSSQLLDMGPDLMEFVRGHIFKIMESDDAKRCQFDGSVSPILSLLESMDETDDESFIEATRILGENLFDIMCDSVTIPAGDLLCVTFQVQSVVHLALLKMNYKVTYVHQEEEDVQANDIVKQRVMPTDSAKLKIVFTTSRCTFLSFTTPFLFSAFFPASSCGLISAAISPPAFKKALAAGSTCISEINDTSIDIKSTFSALSCGR